MNLLSQYRPRRATEIIDASFHFYREHGAVLLLISAVVCVPFAVMAAALPPALSFLAQLGLNLAIPVAHGAIAVTVAESLEGRQIDASDAFGRIGGRVATLIGLQILIGMVVMLGLIFLVVPGIIFLIWTAVALPAAAIEDVGADAAVQRSRQLTRGSAGHVFGTVVLTLVIFFALIIGTSLGIGTVIGLLGFGTRVAEFVGDLVMVPFLPAYALAFTFLYYDLRVRREGADVDAMAAALPTPAPQARAVHG